MPQLKADLEHRFNNSPLRPIAIELARLIDLGFDNSHVRDAVQEAIERFLRMIPVRLDGRFLFDCAIIQDACDAMSGAKPRMSNWIVPCYRGEWGHMFSMALPGQDRETGRPVYLLSLRGNEDLGDANLLDYPWLYHELAHNLLLRHDAGFSSLLQDAILQTTTSLRLRSIADIGAAKQKALSTIDRLLELWTPKSNHHDWSHELAGDVIGLWICGPAYVATFCESVEEHNVNPYQVSAGHPPYDVRAQALTQVANELGWTKAVAQLARLVRSWKNTAWAPHRGNAYLAAAQPVLIGNATAAISTYCTELMLPKCTKETIERARNFLLNNQTPDTSLDLIITAWLVYEERGQRFYEKWERKVVGELAAGLHGDTG